MMGENMFFFGICQYFVRYLDDISTVCVDFFEDVVVLDSMIYSYHEVGVAVGCVWGFESRLEITVNF